MTLTKNADPDKYVYSGCGIRFDSCSDFLWSDGRHGKNVMMFGADMSSSTLIDNRNKNILVLGEGPTKESGNTMTTAEAKYLINFKQPDKRFVLSLHYDKRNCFLFVNAVKIYHLKQKIQK